MAATAAAQLVPTGGRILTDEQRGLVQVMVSRRICPQADLLHLLHTIRGDATPQPTAATLQTSIREINQALQHVDMALMEGATDVTGDVYYVLVNQLGDELAQMATTHKATAVAFFKQVIATIVRAPNKAFSAPEIDLLNAIDKKNHPMPVAAAEALLDDFIMNGWVARDADFNYRLGVRTLLELKGYLYDEFPDDFVECNGCKEFVAYGETCENERCQIRFHIPCSKRFFQNKTMKNCPQCKTPWTFVERPSVATMMTARPSATSRRRAARMLDEDGRDEESPTARRRSDRPSAGRAANGGGSTQKGDVGMDLDD